MKKITEMGYELGGIWLNLIGSDATSEYIKKGYGFTIGGLAAIFSLILLAEIGDQIILFIKSKFKVIKKLLKK